MEHNPIEPVMAVIAYVESHLNEHLNLETVANEAHYSKYHLHRMFTTIAGMTLHDYIRRRQLTESAKLLVFSRKPILEIALTAGYESQQAFTDVFKSMYKQTPLEYREKESFLFCGINIFTSAMFTALSNGKLSAVLSFLRTFGLLAGCILLLPRFFGIAGVWLAVPAAEGIMFLVSVFCLAGYLVSLRADPSRFH